MDDVTLDYYLWLPHLILRGAVWEVARCRWWGVDDVTLDYPWLPYLILGGAISEVASRGRPPVAGVAGAA